MKILSIYFLSRWILLLALIVLMVPVALSQSTQTTADTAVVEKPQPYALTEINSESEKLANMLGKLDVYLVPSSTYLEIDSLLKEAIVYLDKEILMVSDDRLSRIPKNVSESLAKEWIAYQVQLSDWQSSLVKRNTKINENLVELEALKKKWELTLTLAKDSEVPEEVISRINDVLKSIDQNFKILKGRFDAVIILEDKVTEQLLTINATIDKLQKYRDQYRERLLVRDSAPLYAVSGSKDSLSVNLGNIEGFQEAWNDQKRNLKNYYIYTDNKHYSVLIVLLLAILLFWYLRRVAIHSDFFKDDPNRRMDLVIIKRPIISAIFITFLLAMLIYPNRPLYVTQMLVVGMYIPILWLVPKIVSSYFRPGIYMFAGLFLMDIFRLFLYYDLALVRIYILIETILALLVFIWYFRYLSTFRNIKVKGLWSIIRDIAYLAPILLLASLIANILGWFNLSSLVTSAIIQSMMAFILIFAGIKIVKIMFGLILRLPFTHKLKLIKGHYELIERRLNDLIDVIAFFFLVRVILKGFDLYDPFYSWLIGIVDYKWEINESTISMGGILAFILILFITFSLAKLLGVILDEEIFSRFHTARGIPHAVSIVVRYFVIALGIFMALAAAGIDLSKFGLMAGALGVGIGFGLQNIVYNFISGLILAFERPIQIGDTVEVEMLMGRVKSIGVRASNVRTYDGAEVIVPNGNLISNQVINWTLSDQIRRVEVKVGVAYGSNPNQVLELLKKVVVAHTNVLAEPGPLMLFEGFGDSSLNFRALFWVYFETGLSTKSDIAIGIYNALAEANITIPFPQRDIHIISEKKSKGDTGLTITDITEDEAIK